MQRSKMIQLNHRIQTEAMSLEIPRKIQTRHLVSAHKLLQDTSFPTSLNIVLYCDNKRVQSGEYPFNAQLSVHLGGELTHSAAAIIT